MKADMLCRMALFLTFILALAPHTVAASSLSLQADTVPELAALITVDAVQISAGRSHTCALTEQGGVKCWGSNDNGQLGSGADEDLFGFSNIPVDVVGLTGGVRSVAAGYDHTCVVMESSAVKCWGANWQGQLGDGTTDNRSTPVDVVGLGGEVQSLALGAMHSCALMLNDSVNCWGNIVGGDSLTPVKVKDLSGVKAIVANDSGDDDRVRGFTCVLLDAGVKCWGDNSGDQLESFGPGYIDTPQFVVGLGSEVVSIAAGVEYICAVRDNGSVKCMGRVSTGPDSGAQAVAAGNRHTCVLTDTGDVACWGGNTVGQLGNGTTEDSDSPFTVAGLDDKAIAVVAGGFHTCALLQDHSVRCWGSNGVGQSGDGEVTTGDSIVPVDVVGLDGDIQSIAAGWMHNCAVTENNSVRCWGNNGNGQLGDGNLFTVSHVPVEVMNLKGKVLEVAEGVEHSDALMMDGSVKRWGNGNVTPEVVSGLSSGVKDFTSNCALLENGSVRCWDLLIPGLGDSVRAIAGNHFFACAISGSNGVACWRLEVGDFGEQTLIEPEGVPGLEGEVIDIAVSAGHYGTVGHACALLNEGDVQCWGSNESGQLGDGTTTDRDGPVDVVGLDGNVIAIAAGANHTCGIIDGGAVRCWGRNWDGALGDGTRENRSAPVDVVGLSSGVQAIAAGGSNHSGFSSDGSHTCALLEGGSVKCWGSDEAGQLGNGVGRLTPVAVVGLGTPRAISIASTPNLSATEGISYTYAITTVNTSDMFSITAQVLPGWLDLADNGDGTALLSGIPANVDYGDNAVLLVVMNTSELSATQSFTIEVTGAGSVQGVIYADDNRNGVQDVGESGVPSATVTLSNTVPLMMVQVASLPAQLSTVTDETGMYRFSGVPTGNYAMLVAPPAAWMTLAAIPVVVSLGEPTVVYTMGIRATLAPLFLPDVRK